MAMLLQTLADRREVEIAYRQQSSLFGKLFRVFEMENRLAPRFRAQAISPSPTRRRYEIKAR
jgi:hypothetical protein